MRGYPSHLNSKQDYEYVLANFPREKWEKDLRAVLEGRMGWYPAGELAVGEDGVFIEGQKTVIESDDGTRTQYEIRENPDAKIFRLGFTVKEVEAMLA